MDSFSDLVNRLRVGDDQAALRVFNRFAASLIGLARSRIDVRVRHKVDPEDVVQSAYRSFFRRHQHEPFQLENWDSLWGLLSLITLRKCAKQQEYFRAGRRNATREVGLENIADESLVRFALADREPTPEDAALLVEAVERSLQGFDPDDRQVIELCLQGYSVREISEQLKRAERSVRRLRERVHQRLLRFLAEDLDNNSDNSG